MRITDNFIRQRISAGQNAVLKSDGDIKLQAAQSTSDQHSSSSSSSAAVGIAATYGANGPAFGITANAAASRGNADGSDVTNTNTHVSAGNTLILASGHDTHLVGAVASANQVWANVGTSGQGKLNIQSVQDTSTYHSKDQSLGGSVTVGAGFSGSASASQSKVNGDYASVGEQSGIKAGDGGFIVNVHGNTDLTGGVIASTATKDRNVLITQTLTQSDLRNHSSYDASSMSIGGGYGKPGGSKDGVMAFNGGVTGTAAGFSSANGHADGASHGGVSAGTVVITDDAKQQQLTGQTATDAVAAIHHEVGAGNAGSIDKHWDGQQLKDKVAAEAQITAAFGQAASKEIGDYAGRKQKEAADRGDTDTAAKWAEGGEYRVALHTGVGALTGGVQGAAGAFASAESMSAIAGAIDQMEMPEAVRQGLSQVAATALGVAVGGGAGAAAGLNVEANNRQLHQSEYDFAKKNAKVVADALSKKEGREVTVGEAEGRIVAELQRNSDLQTAQASGGKIDYDIRGIVGCQNLNCNGSTTDSQYANHNYNSELIAPNQTVYNLGQAEIGTGLTPSEYRSENIVSERIGKGVLAITSCALAGPAVCQAAVKGLGIALSLSYATGSTVTTAGAIGSAYGGVVGGIYGQNLAAWSGETSSLMQNATLWVTKTGSVFGGKQVGTSFGNGTALGGSIDPLFDSVTNPWWGAKNTWDLVKGEK